MSMVGYILGLGDRHPNNLMMSRKTGKIVHIDFGDCFEVAQYRVKFPEKVPFRLTRMLIKALEIAGIEGTFRIISEEVMGIMREKKDLLLAIFSSLIHDPLISFRLMIQRGEKDKDKNRNRNLDSQKNIEGNNNGNTNGNNGNISLSKKFRGSMINGIEGEGGSLIDINYRDENTTPSGEGSSNLDVGVKSVGSRFSRMINSGKDNNTHKNTSKENKNKRFLNNSTKFKDYNENINEEETKNEKKNMDNEQRQMFHKYEEKDEIESEELNEKAEMVVDRITEKLNGLDFEKNNGLDVKSQVNRLINQATSHENLAQSYIGWCPFW